MTTSASPSTMSPAAEQGVRALHQQVLERWNQRDAAGYAALFVDDALVVGFDGSEMASRAEIESQLAAIFKRHKTPAYVAKVRSVRVLAPGVAMLHAVAGMAREGQADPIPEVNAVQVLVAVERASGWRVSVFQNTPAAYHGRPELSAQLTEELRQELARSRR